MYINKYKKMDACYFPLYFVDHPLFIKEWINNSPAPAERGAARSISLSLILARKTQEPFTDGRVEKCWRKTIHRDRHTAHLRCWSLMYYYAPLSLLSSFFASCWSCQARAGVKDFEAGISNCRYYPPFIYK